MTASSWNCSILPMECQTVIKRYWPLRPSPTSGKSNTAYIANRKSKSISSSINNSDKRSDQLLILLLFLSWSSSSSYGRRECSKNLVDLSNMQQLMHSWWKLVAFLKRSLSSGVRAFQRVYAGYVFQWSIYIFTERCLSSSSYSVTCIMVGALCWRIMSQTTGTLYVHFVCK